MKLWGRVLIVDDSAVYSKLMATLMAPYAEAVHTATNVEDGIRSLEEHRDIELVLCDLVMEGRSGLDFLEYVHGSADPKPRVVMVTGFPSDQAAEQACQLGAAAYLCKPTSVRKIISALKLFQSGERRQVNPRWRCSGKAYLIDEGAGHVVWDVYNISIDGAFLETKGPLPLGTEMEIQFQLSSGKATVRARAVRVQEPSWIDVAGVGVEFVDISDEAERIICAAIASAEPHQG